MSIVKQKKSKVCIPAKSQKSTWVSKSRNSKPLWTIDVLGVVTNDEIQNSQKIDFEIKVRAGFNLLLSTQKK